MEQVYRLSEPLLANNNELSKRKPKLLFLCQRPPYPADKGDKIRSFNVMRELSQYFEIHLGALTETQNELQYTKALHQWCASVQLVYLPQWQRKLQALQCLFIGKPITKGWFFNQALQKWVNQQQNKQFDSVLVYCSSMAQYIEQSVWQSTNCVIDFVDVDSAKWREYAARSSQLKSWLYQREARLLERYEQYICSNLVRAAFLVSEAECARLQQPANCQAHIGYYANGVDLAYYQPQSNVLLHSHDIVFTGAMDYLPNIDAVQWFVLHCWPAIQQCSPNARLVIVGSNPAKSIKKLMANPNIIITGQVPDVRPYLANAALAIAPMQLGGGIKNKVLEAIAMSRPMVVSTLATQGLKLPNDPALIVADSAEETIAGCLHFLQHPCASEQLRDWISQHASWAETIKPLLSALNAKDAA
ncbi:TIGR03087 family PEP-CTERM/XrtA system glycosyltransferase [Rheinheimera sp. UJ63]|uniref:TIGR03087 family PEP-CTERM/XrtA system glycosyltransferase n=1 Tax=Rheinheimera sp. UJ63 TaxID=2910157 RepID=UPI001F185A7B|nr:TIGR03087 family PEP-CTERM/XrtA system glycosyltransferase [Rheinheimera sp. UJ63]MCF4007789.1 TIGR03087 family PEP-CTERM/XrtA system glycosyltransferase [Rheinheimera sp. UJ63]